jgi:hypothetical protein
MSKVRPGPFYPTAVRLSHHTSAHPTLETDEKQIWTDASNVPVCSFRDIKLSMCTYLRFGGDNNGLALSSDSRNF